MGFSSLLRFLLIGLVAGWLADMIFKNRFELFRDLIIGIVGSFIGGWLFGQFGISSSGFWGEIFTAFIGAVVLLSMLNLIRGK